MVDRQKPNPYESPKSMDPAPADRTNSARSPLRMRTIIFVIAALIGLIFAGEMFPPQRSIIADVAIKGGAFLLLAVTIRIQWRLWRSTRR